MIVLPHCWGVSAPNQKVKWLGMFDIPPSLELSVPININLPWLPDTPFPLIYQNSKLHVVDYISVCKFAIGIRLT